MNGKPEIWDFVAQLQRPVLKHGAFTHIIHIIHHLTRYLSMKHLHIPSVLTAFLASVLLGFAPAAVYAATTPVLGAAETYSVLASTYTNTTATTINGDVGFTTGPAVTPTGTHTNYGSGAPYAMAGADQGAALSSLNSQPCTFTFAPGAINLSTDITHGAAGVYAPGVYCSAGAMNIGGALTLSGNGTYIFRPSGALTSTTGSVVSLSAGAVACDVFWTPTQATTLAANTTFVGTVIDDAAITVGANTTWTGRGLSFGGTITTDSDTITALICAVVPAVIPVVVPPVVVPVVTPVVVPIVPPVTPTITPIVTPAVLPIVPSASPITLTPTPSITPLSSGTANPLIPSLPSTGFGPQDTSTSSSLIALSIALMAALALIVRKKQS